MNGKTITSHTRNGAMRKTWYNIHVYAFTSSFVGTKRVVYEHVMKINRDSGKMKKKIRLPRQCQLFEEDILTNLIKYEFYLVS